MNRPSSEPDGGWPRGWDEHRRRQLRRTAALPFAEKLEWLEEAQALAEALTAARNREAGKAALPKPSTC